MSSTLTCNIQINSKIKLKFVNDLSIDDNSDSLNTTGKMILPFTLKYRKGNGMSTPIYNDLIKIGDPISISIGYDHNNHEAFTGYISDIIPNLPTTVFFEDDIWLLKQIPIKKSFNGASLATIIEYVFNIAKQTYPQLKYNLTANIINTGKLVYDNYSIAEILKDLKNKFGIYTWCRNGVVNIGLQYDNKVFNRSIFKFQYNIIDDDLIYKKAADFKFNVRAVSYLKVGKKYTKIESNVGDPHGASRTFHFYNIDNADELTSVANVKLKTQKYDGYRGSFTAFGEPFTRPGDSVKLIDTTIPDRNGIYIVCRVIYRFGFSTGIRQEIFLDTIDSR